MLKLSEPVLVKKNKFRDSRGYFYEAYNKKSFKKTLNINENFVQDNISFSKKGVIRGLHFQTNKPQGKFVSVIIGKIFDIIVDIRPNSKNFLKKYTFNLDGVHNYSLWVPPGFAHGFQSLANETIVFYKCTNFYSPNSEKTVIFNDPELNIKWPLKNFSISKKDKKGITLNKLFKNSLS